MPTEDERSFVFPPLSREDLADAKLSGEEIAHLTDEDLIVLAQMVKDHYVLDVFLDDVAYIARHILQHKWSRTETED